MYTGTTFDSSGQFYSPQYKSLMYLGGWQGVERLISDRCLTETTISVVAKPLILIIKSEIIRMYSWYVLPSHPFFRSISSYQLLRRQPLAALPLLGIGRGFAPSKHLYFDDFYINFAKNLPKFLKNPPIFANLTHSVSIIIFPLCNFQTSKCNLYLMIFTFILKNLPKFLKKSSKFNIQHH